MLTDELQQMLGDIHRTGMSAEDAIDYDAIEPLLDKISGSGVTDAIVPFLTVLPWDELGYENVMDIVVDGAAGMPQYPRIVAEYFDKLVQSSRKLAHRIITKIVARGGDKLQEFMSAVRNAPLEVRNLVCNEFRYERTQPGRPEWIQERYAALYAALVAESCADSQ